MRAVSYYLKKTTIKVFVIQIRRIKAPICFRPINDDPTYYYILKNAISRSLVAIFLDM